MTRIHVLRQFLCSSLLFLALTASAQTDHDSLAMASKIAGLNLVSMDRLMKESEMEPITDLYANWSAIIPYAFVRDLHQPELMFDTKFQWIGERIEGVAHSVQMLHSNGIRVMFKPQIWVGHGDFTGHIEMYSEEDWLAFEAGYRDYILSYAKLAEEEGVEMYCIGTELAIFVANRPAFWHQLIKDVRAVYSGKITYAENWDSYGNVPFWEELDYIGIDAYFPLAQGKNPKIKSLKTGWTQIREDLAELTSHTGRQAIFTEYGYRSTARCAEEPWNYRTNDQLSEKAQYHALQSLYETIWLDPWFGGGFLWKWYPDHEGRSHGTDHYTVQHKKAEHLVRGEYEKCCW